MKIKKIIALSLATTIVAAVCSSCGQQADGGKVSLSVGNWPANEGDWLNTMNQYEVDFEAENPDIDIVPDTWGFDLKTFYPKAESGLLPDIFITPFTEFQKVTDGDYAEDITDALKDCNFYENLNKRLLDEICSRDGKIYAVPKKAYVLGVNINLKLWKEAGLLEADGTPKQPATWEELAEFASIIKEKTGKPGFTLCTTNNCGGWFFTNIAWSYGVEFMKQQEDGKWKATFDTQEAVDALQFIKDLKWKYNCVPDNNLVDQEEALKLLATYQTGMILDGPRDNVNKYEMDTMDYGMIPLPAGPKRHVALFGGELRFLAKDTTFAQHQAAMKWLKFIGFDYQLTDEAKTKKEDEYKKKIEDKVPVGIKELAVWNEESDNIKFRDEMVAKYINMSPNGVKLYNESLGDTSIEFQAEEPVCCQDLYGVLDNIIQEVYTNKDADCAALIKKANDDFQKNFLDKAE